MVALLMCVLCLADPYLYVRVPYSKAVDEVLYQEAAAGKVKLPEGFSRRGGKLYTTRTADGKEAEVPELMAGMFVFDCHYDNEGSYFMRSRLYDDLKGKLVHKRQGRLESFALPGTIKPGELPDPKDPKAWETYIWDTEGMVWRWPFTLEKVAKGHKLKSGQLLYSVKPVHMPPGATTSPLDKLAEQYAARKRKR